MLDRSASDNEISVRRTGKHMFAYFPLFLWFVISWVNSISIIGGFSKVYVHCTNVDITVGYTEHYLDIAEYANGGETFL